MRQLTKRDERGAAALLVSISMVALVVAVAMVLDFGVVRQDRQMNKSSTDAAVTAGMRGLDQGNGKAHSYAGICQALTYLKLSQAELADLPSSSNAAGGDVSCPPTVSQLSEMCIPGTTSHAYVATHGRLRVTIKSPYSVDEGDFPEESSQTHAQDDGDPAQQGCDQIGVIIEETKSPEFGRLATSADITSRIRSVGRIAMREDGEGAVALLMLERVECGVITINGVDSFVTVQANGDVPGLIHSDSEASACSGNQRVMTGDHANGILAQESPTLSGIIRVRALSTANAIRAYDSTTNVVAQVSTPGPGPLVTRAPVDAKYRTAAQAAFAEFRAQTEAGYTHVFDCNETEATLEAVPQNESIWINCTNGNETWSVSDVTFKATKVYFNAKQVTAANTSLPNATRVYIRGDTSNNGTGLSVSNTKFQMHHGGSSTCPDTTTTPSAERARLVIGAGNLSSNSGGTVQLCSTTVLLGGGSVPGCVPGSDGTAPTSLGCNGRLSLGGTTDWTAPSTTSGPVADPTLYQDLEDLALWTEADGSHDVGGGGSMHLSGVFMMPNGEFKVHGGGTQDVRNSQYIARKFRADGGSELLMQPNPYDVVTIPIIGGFSLVR